MWNSNATARLGNKRSYYIPISVVILTGFILVMYTHPWLPKLSSVTTGCRSLEQFQSRGCSAHLFLCVKSPPSTHTCLSSCHGGLLALTHLSCSDRNLLITCHLYHGTFSPGTFVFVVHNRIDFDQKVPYSGVPLERHILNACIWTGTVWFHWSHLSELMSEREHRCWPVGLIHIEGLHALISLRSDGFEYGWKPGKACHTMTFWHLWHLL